MCADASSVKRVQPSSSRWEKTHLWAGHRRGQQTHAQLLIFDSCPVLSVSSDPVGPAGPDAAARHDPAGLQRVPPADAAPPA